jgi:hypothetical protein
MTGFTLDTGALIAVEREHRGMGMMLRAALMRKKQVVVPAGVLAQAWRNPRRQVRLVRFLASEGVQVEPLDHQRAKEAGQLCGLTRTSDIVDASVVLCARARKHVIVTSDPEDLRRLDPDVELLEI